MYELYAVVGLCNKEQRESKYIKLKTNQSLHQLIDWYRETPRDIMIVEEWKLPSSFTRLSIFLKVVDFFIIRSTDREICFTVSSLGENNFIISNARYVTIPSSTSIYSIRI